MSLLKREQHINEDRGTTSVKVQFDTVILLGTSFDEREKTPEEKCCKSFGTGRYHFLCGKSS